MDATAAGAPVGMASLTIMGVLLLSSLLVGCMGGSGPDAVVDVGDDAQSHADETRAEEQPQEDSLSRHVEIIGHEGRTQWMVCLWAGVATQCMDMPLEGDEDFEYREVPPGTLQALRGNLTWEAESLLSEQLRVRVALLQDGDWWMRSAFPSAEGTSPIAFDWDLRNFEAEGVRIEISAMHHVDLGAAAISVFLAQDYRLEGKVVSVEQ